MDHKGVHKAGCNGISQTLTRNSVFSPTMPCLSHLVTTESTHLVAPVFPTFFQPSHPGSKSSIRKFLQACTTMATGNCTQSGIQLVNFKRNRCQHQSCGWIYLFTHSPRCWSLLLVMEIVCAIQEFSPEVAVQSRSFVQYSKSRSKNKKHKWSDLTSTTGRPAQTVLQDFIEAMDTGFQRLGSYLGLMIASRAFQFISFYVILCHSIAHSWSEIPLQLRDRVENTTVEPTTGTTTPEADPSCSRWCLHVKWQMSSWLVNSLSVYASLCMIYRILDHLDHLGGSSNQGIPNTPILWPLEQQNWW